MIPKTIWKISHYVNDFSWVIEKDTHKKLDELFAKIDTKTSLQVVTLLFPHREWRQLKSIALEVFNSTWIGQKWKNNGLLLVISTQEKKIRIMTGKGLEWIYHDSWCRDVIEKKLRPLLNTWKYEELIRVWKQEILKKQTSSSWNPSRVNSVGALWGTIFMSPFITIFFTIIQNIFSFQFAIFLLFIVFLGVLLYFKKSSRWTKISIISIFLIILLIGYNGEKNKIFCEKNPQICQQREIERQSSQDSSSYNSSSSSNWWSSSSSSNWSSSSSSSFWGWGGRSNGWGFWD